MQPERSHTRGLVFGQTLSAEQIPFLPLMLGTMALLWFVMLWPYDGLMRGPAQRERRLG